MSMLEWAKKEVEIATKGCSNDEFDYGAECYKSALRAFEILCKDEHSGMSIKFTQRILNRMIDGKPLTAIEDTEDSWNEVGKNEYQCKRMSSLFKDVDSDGNIMYNDIDRAVFVDINNETKWSSGLATKIIDELFPISMPYYPSSKPYIVYGNEYLSNKCNGDFDSIHFLYLINPDGEKIELNRYFTEIDGKMTEVSKEKFEKLKKGE